MVAYRNIPNAMADYDDAYDDPFFVYQKFRLKLIKSQIEPVSFNFLPSLQISSLFNYTNESLFNIVVCLNFFFEDKKNCFFLLDKFRAQAKLSFLNLQVLKSLDANTKFFYLLSAYR